MKTPSNVLLKRRLVWLIYEPRLGWLAISFAIVSLYILFIVRDEPLLRWWGMLLQFVGIYAVVKELRSTQAHFNRPGITTWFMSWLQSWPRGPRSVSFSAEAGISLGGSARMTIRSHAAEGASVEERILVLEKNLSRIDEELSQASSQMEKEAQELRTSIKAESELRATDIKRVETKLEEVSAAALPFSLFGIYCLAGGVLLATAAPEFTKWAGLRSAPNPSIERTSPGKPGAASHVKRYALSFSSCGKWLQWLHRITRASSSPTLCRAVCPLAAGAPVLVRVQ